MRRVADYTPLADKVELLQEALNHHELYKYMIGEDDYAYINRDADIPTDPDSVVESINTLVEQTGDLSIWNDFELCWLKMSKDDEYSWFSLYILISYLRYNKHESTPLDLKSIIPQLVDNIKSKKDKLASNKKWLGRNWDNGLWDNVIAISKVINDKFKLNLSF